MMFVKMRVFSGFKNLLPRPIHIIKNEELGIKNEELGIKNLREVKGDKKSIGGKQKEIKRVFTNHEMELNNDDIIYLSSDGFVDQNNELNKKFG